MTTFLEFNHLAANFDRRSALVALAKLADPNVAITHGVPMVLQSYKNLRSMRRRIFRKRFPGLVGMDAIGHADQLISVLDYDPVVQDCDAGFFDQVPVRAPARRFENDVIRLPIAGRLAGIHTFAR